MLKKVSNVALAVVITLVVIISGVVVDAYLNHGYGYDRERGIYKTWTHVVDENDNETWVAGKRDYGMTISRIHMSLSDVVECWNKEI